jgi:hypothetical protein
MQRKKILHFSSKIEVRQSPIEGYGVFAKEKIEKGEILEESPFILFPFYTLLSKHLFDTLKSNGAIHPKEKYITNLAKNLGFKDPEDYYFKWMPKYQPTGEEIVYTVIPLGFGPIYNTSNSTNNAEWKIEEKTFVFTASKDIEKDEEICTFYGYFLDEEGTKFECDDVFNIGFDYFDGKVSFKSVRFGSLPSYQSSINDPFFIEIQKLLKNTSKAIYLTKLSALSQDGVVQSEIKIPKIVSLKDLFNKLKEIKLSSLQFIQFNFEYIDKNDSLTKDYRILWKR